MVSAIRAMNEWHTTSTPDPLISSRFCLACRSVVSFQYERRGNRCLSRTLVSRGFEQFFEAVRIDYSVLLRAID